MGCSPCFSFAAARLESQAVSSEKPISPLLDVEEKAMGLTESTEDSGPCADGAPDEQGHAEEAPDMLRDEVANGLGRPPVKAVSDENTVGASELLQDEVANGLGGPPEKAVADEYTEQAPVMREDELANNLSAPCVKAVDPAQTLDLVDDAAAGSRGATPAIAVTATAEESGLGASKEPAPALEPAEIEASSPSQDDCPAILPDLMEAASAFSTSHAEPNVTDASSMGAAPSNKLESKQAVEPAIMKPPTGSALPTVSAPSSSQASTLPSKESSSKRSPLPPISKPLEPAVDDDEIDLARLCSAFTSLEQSRSSVQPEWPAGTPSCSSSARPSVSETQTSHWSLPGAPYSGASACSSSMRPHSDDVTSPYWSLPGDARYASQMNGSSSQATTPPITRAWSDSTTPLVERGVSGGTTASLGNWSHSPTGSMVNTMTSPSNKRGGAMTPIEFHTQSEVVAGRMRDAQRMDAWFQRSLSKRAASGPLSPAAQRAMPVTPQTAASPTLQSPLDLEKLLPTSAPPLPIKLEPPSGVSNAEEASPVSGSTFSLEVQLSGDVLGTLNFCHDDKIDAVCETFVTEKRLRPIFLAPLVAHAELMAHMDKRVDSVDAIDLI